ncbi:MAG: hypothetical protein HOV80_09190 [Polyangiaceae bacterium]|nr:hypothetical protein [Polyangiaceae bacterium]
MCQRTTCSACGRPTFIGCGRHIEQVLGDVPKEERCQCSAKKGPTNWLSALLGGGGAKTKEG